MIKSNYEIIKAIVEKISKEKDISIKSQVVRLTMLRLIYYKLCKDCYGKEYNHRMSSEVINRHYKNSRGWLNSFDSYKNQIFFSAYYIIYIDCGYELLELEVKINQIIKEQTLIK